MTTANYPPHKHEIENMSLGSISWEILFWTNTEATLANDRVVSCHTYWLYYGTTLRRQVLKLVNMTVN